jgi:hypothetical protein
MSNMAISNFTFHNNISSVVTGNEYSVSSGATDISIEFTGTGTFTAIIEGKIQSNYYPIKSVNLSSLTISSSVSELNSLWQTDLVGLSALRVRITSISGTVSIYGRSVN